jgi:hypothetical protein
MCVCVSRPFKLHPLAACLPLLCDVCDALQATSIGCVFPTSMPFKLHPLAACFPHFSVMCAMPFKLHPLAACFPLLCDVCTLQATSVGCVFPNQNRFAKHRLHNCRIGVRGVGALAAALPHSSLTFLSLVDNTLLPYGVRALASALRQCTSLRELHLARCEAHVSVAVVFAFFCLLFSHLFLNVYLCIFVCVVAFPTREPQLDSRPEEPPSPQHITQSPSLSCCDTPRPTCACATRLSCVD